MRAGEVILFLVFNIGVIFGLYHWQMRMITKKLGCVKHEIQELEDLVVAIIEEFGEAVSVDQNTPKPELEAELKPQLNQAPAAEVKPEAAPTQPTRVKLKATFEPPTKVKPETTSAPQPRAKAQPIPGPPPEVIPKVTAVLESEVKRELIPPQKPKAKGKSAKPTPTALTSNNPISSSTNAAAGNPAPKRSLPLNKVPGSKHQKVLSLAQQGMEVSEIAKQLKMGQGEIQLILGLYNKSN